MAKLKSSFFGNIRQFNERSRNEVNKDPSPEELPENPLFVKEESDEEDVKQEPSKQEQIESSSEFIQFKKDVLAVLPVPETTLVSLFTKFRLSEEKVLLAVDHFLLKNESSSSPIPPILLTSNPKRKRTRGVVIPFSYKKHHTVSLPVKLPKPNPKPESGWRRYLGTMFVEAYATRPYLRPLPAGKSMTLKSHRPKSTNKRKQEQAVVRLYTSPNEDFLDEREIGKFKEDMTRILAPLLDLNLLQCEVSVAVETTKRLSIGDGFFLTIDCYVNDHTFAWKSTENEIDLIKTKSLKTRFNAGAETESETVLRLRQYAISHLFSKLQVRSVKLKDNKELPGTQFPTTQIIDDVLESNDPNNPIEIDLDSEDDTDPNELSLDQLQTFYSENQQSEMLKALPDTTSPPKENFLLELRGYQKLGLSWMLAREKELDVLKMLTANEDELEQSLSLQSISEYELMEEGVMNPLWKTFKWPQSDDTPPDESKYFYGNMYSGELSLEKPLIRTSLRGGILADEMGLGKTISALALINSVPYDTKSSLLGNSDYASQTTLVIVPMSLLSQWKKEFDKANNNLNHKCIVYYGQSAVVDLSTLLVNKTKHIPIMIVTTYGTVLSEYTKIENRRDSYGNLPKTGLYSVKFFRIIIDEGHQIRNRVNKTSRAIFDLQLSRKWVLTGTPIINRLDDLYSIVKFLELEPWNNFSYWKMFITLPFEQKQVKQTLDVIRTILEPIFLRRTKNMKGEDGRPLVELPLKEVVIEEVEFNERESRLYNWFKEKAYKTFKDNLDSGELLRQYSQILTHILRLRQICCHQDLIKSLVTEMDEDMIQAENLSEEEAQKVREIIDDSGDKYDNHTEMLEDKFKLYDKIDLNNSECSICTKTPIDITEMTATTCGHCFCLNCLIEHLEFQQANDQANTCPNCRAPVSMYKLFKVRDRVTSKKEFKFHTGKEIADDIPFDLYLYDPTKVSSKVQALINHIVTLKDQKANEPLIVFSQFSSYLHIIDNELKLQIGEKNVRCLKFDGRLSQVQRQKLLDDFNQSVKNSNKLTILLLSLKAGGVGLNLTTASRAFMMDPWWSPSIEDQAIDRLHRIGQSRNVKVVRFIMKNSIETNMLKIQARKRELGEVVAAEEEEKRKTRIEELKMLFDE